MSFYIGSVLLLFAALMEAAVLPMFRIAGLQPNLVLVILIAWLLVRGVDETLFLIPVGGLWLGLVDGAPMGVALLALAPIVLLHELRSTILGEGPLAITIGFAFAATIVYHFTYLVVFLVGGASGNWPDAFLRVAVPTALLNLLILGPTYLLLWQTSPGLRRVGYA